MAIQSEFLASLRRRLRPELVITLVQLEQLCPAWWASLSELAEQLGTDRASLNRSLRQLEQRGLIRRCTYSNRGGTWIWWVQRHEGHAPRPEEEPAWVLSRTTSHHYVRVPVSSRREWAQARGIPLTTLVGFLYGRQTVLRGAWRVVASPFDCEDLQQPSASGGNDA